MSKPKIPKKITDNLDPDVMTDAVLAGLVHIAERGGVGADEALTAICGYMCARSALFATFRKYLDAAALVEGDGK